jgi:glucokinase
MLFLSGDVGGTKTILAIYESKGKKLKCIKSETYPSKNYNCLEEIIELFLSKERIAKACFGVAGPVENNICIATNLPWVVKGGEIAKKFKIPIVFIINDLKANAYGLKTLSSEDFFVLNKGKKVKWGNQCLISAGTGLGEAPIFFNGSDLLPSDSEGGHCDFAPRNEKEVELLLYLSRKFGHVSYERVLSGSGIVNIYEFLIDQKYYQEKPSIKKQIKIEDPAEVISRAAKEKKCPACVETLRWFCSIYGAEAGNLALKVFAIGGTFIGGGIAPKIIDQIKGGEFFKAFTDKGRFSSFLQNIPVYVVLDLNTTLKGSAYYCLKN